MNPQAAVDGMLDLLVQSHREFIAENASLDRAFRERQTARWVQDHHPDRVSRQEPGDGPDDQPAADPQPT
jgi:hypothetical protein